MEEKQKLRDKAWFIALMIIFIIPVGIIFLVMKRDWNIGERVITFTAIVIVITLFVVGSS